MIYKDIFKGTIELTDERWYHITKEHPEVKEYREKIQEVLTSPDYIKKSSRDAKVLLYYKYYRDIFVGKFLLVVVKKDLRSFILTCYITDAIKRGETLWERK